MNNKLKALQTHFDAKRQRIITELDSIINGNAVWDFEKAEFLIRELSAVNVCANTVDMIVKDNTENTDSNNTGISLEHYQELEKMAQAINEKLANHKETDKSEENA